MKRRLENVLIICLLFAVFGFLGIRFGPYYLNAIDSINLRHEEKNKFSEADRTIHAKIVIDRGSKDIISKQRDYGFFRENGSFLFVKSWGTEEFIERIVRRASRSFEYQFGIEIVLAEIKTWDPQESNSKELIRELHQTISLDNYDIVIGFTSKAKDMSARSFLPHNNTLGNFIIIPVYLPEEIGWIGHVFSAHQLLSYVLIHELGHSFGAVHPEEIHSFPLFPDIEKIQDVEKIKSWLKEILKYFQKTFSVMNLKTGYFTTHFDSYNKEIILGNKHLPSK